MDCTGRLLASALRLSVSDMSIREEEIAEVIFDRVCGIAPEFQMGFGLAIGSAVTSTEMQH
jgi:hypothetical protein